jgi:hypothetical protein
MKCLVCGAFFWHLHTLPRTVVGYHGCNRAFARGLVANRISLDEWKASKNTYDWLGEGVYFWEHAPGRAWQRAKECHGDEPAVVATEIRLGKCLDFGDTVFAVLLRQSYDNTVEHYTKNEWTLPTNSEKQQALRKLDKLVIDRLIQASSYKGIGFQTVRCPFEEGEAVYAGGMIKEQSHIQIAVRDKACISPQLFLVDPMEAHHEQ